MPVALILRERNLRIVPFKHQHFLVALFIYFPCLDSSSFSVEGKTVLPGEEGCTSSVAGHVEQLREMSERDK